MVGDKIFDSRNALSWPKGVRPEIAHDNEKKVRPTDGANPTDIDEIRRKVRVGFFLN